MEPLNLMVSLSHFANTKNENEHGLSKPAGRRSRLRFSPRLKVQRLVLRRARALP